MAMGAVVLATTVTVVLPTQVQGDLLLGQWRRPIAQPVESPAMGTFRALAASRPLAASVGTAPLALTSGPTATGCEQCIPLESGHEWRTGTSPTLPLRAAGWQAGGWPWEMPDGSAPTHPEARPLWGVDSDRGRVGLYLVDSTGR